jgi:hypothetical protein
VTETEPKDPENVFAAMQMQGVLTKMLLREIPASAWKRIMHRDPSTARPDIFLTNNFSWRFAQDDSPMRT